MSARNTSYHTGLIASSTKTVTNTSSGNTLGAVVVTQFLNSSFSAIMELTQEISFGVNDKFFTNSVTIKNTSGVTWTSTRYMRSFDPDNTAGQSGSYDTENEVLAVQPGDGKAVVRARTKTSDNSIVPTTYDTRAPILFYSAESTAKGSSWGFANNNPFDSRSWNSTTPAKGTPVVADQAINLTFEQGSLAANASTKFT